MRAVPPAGPTWRYLVGAIGGLVVLVIPGILWAGGVDSTLKSHEKSIDRIEEKLDRILEAVSVLPIKK